MKHAKNAYVVNAQVAFMPSPMRGLWLQVHPSVLFVGCTTCGARVQKLCIGVTGKLGTGTHHMRRRDFAKWRKVRARKDEFKIVLSSPGAL